MTVPLAASPPISFAVGSWAASVAQQGSVATAWGAAGAGAAWGANQRRPPAAGPASLPGPARARSFNARGSVQLAASASVPDLEPSFRRRQARDVDPAERIEGFDVSPSSAAAQGLSHSVVPFPGGKNRLRRTSFTDGKTTPQVARRVSLEINRPTANSSQASVANCLDSPPTATDYELYVIPPSPLGAQHRGEGLLYRELKPDGSMSPNGKVRMSLSMASRAAPMSSPSKSDLQLLAACQSSYAVFKSPIVVAAFNIASSAHEGQRWHDNEIFLSHAVGTATILADLGLDETTVAVGLLHGILDRTMMTPETLAELLPVEGMLQMIEKVSRLSELSQLHHHDSFVMDDASLRKFRAMLLSMADVRIVIIKLAERVNSLRTLGALDSASRNCLAKEALELFAPLANRLGVWGLKAELEDLAFQTLHPADYSALKKRTACNEQAASITAHLDQLKSCMEKAGIHAEDLCGRPKNLYSLFQKIRNKGYSIDEIYDVKAVRVIVNSKEDCYNTLKLVHSLWEPMPGRLKDYIRNKKENGYQSLHTIVVGEDGVPFEVQIRTAKMHYIAEHGVAAHWRYKEQAYEGANCGQASDSMSSMDDCGVSPDCVTEVHVEIARWLITWELELQDKKCRPSGSPERDTALSSLQGQLCRFPTHNEACPFHRLQKGRPEVPKDDVSPIYCVVVRRSLGDGDGSAPSNAIRASHTELMQLPQGINTQKLVQDGHLGDPTLLVGKQILVNHLEEERPGETVLRMGDQIELIDALNCDDDLLWETTVDEEPQPCDLFPYEIDEQRKLFDTIYQNSSGGMQTVA